MFKAAQMALLFVFSLVIGLTSLSWLNSVVHADASELRTRLASIQKTNAESCTPQVYEEEVFFTGCGGIF